jgi:hypothetical protein
MKGLTYKEHLETGVLWLAEEAGEAIHAMCRNQRVKVLDALFDALGAILVTMSDLEPTELKGAHERYLDAQQSRGRHLATEHHWHISTMVSNMARNSHADCFSREILAERAMRKEEK